MIKNYFKTAWRNLLKNKFYSVINIMGLTIGLAVGILILLWVQDELSFDKFNKQSADIYKLENMVGTGSSVQIWRNTVAPIGVMGKRELPEVKDAVRLSGRSFFSLYKYREKVFNEDKVTFTDPSLFSIFDFKLISGNIAKPFTDDNSIILTETTAKRYFGDEDPINKVITADDTTRFTVTGIIKDFPKNSSIQGDMFLPMSLLNKKMYAGKSAGENIDNDFREFNYTTFFLLKPGVSLANLATKLRNIHLRNKPDDTDLTYMLQTLPAMHLYKSDGKDSGIETVQMFAIIALLILVIACINYVNLSTARAMLRSKEVSMRKIVGAAKWHLFLQFIIETTLVFLLATILAIGLMYLLMPVFNGISGKELVFDLTDYHVWLVILTTIGATLAASSIYPAVLLSSFEPLKALKGKIAVNLSDAAFRKILVVTQFAFSIVLIAGTFVISNQLKFIRTKALGYDKEHVYSFFMRNMSRHYDAVSADLLNQPGIAGVTRSSDNIVQIGSQTGDNSWDGKAVGQTMMVHPMAMDKNFIQFFKIQLEQGAGFTGSVSDSAHFILNETAVKATGIKDPIGKKFKMWQTEGTIIGVVKDFHFASLKEKIEPAVMIYVPGFMDRIFIKTAGDDPANALAATEKIWKAYNPGFAFNYAFLDDTFNELYKSEQRTGTLFNVFAAIAIFISCLGLFGLAAFTAQLRTREIGVRKAIGASVSSIIRLLAKDFVQLVLVAIVIAVPVAWYLMDKWLQGFAYRINMGWVVFLLSGSIAILIAVATISFQSVRAAIANPVKSLKTE